MTQQPPSLRNHFLLFLGLGIGLLSVMAGTGFWDRRFREGGLFLVAAIVLAIVFFRRRLLALCLCVLSVVIALSGLGAISHRSGASAIVALTAIVIAYLLARWDVNKHQARALGDWQSLFENDDKTL